MELFCVNISYIKKEDLSVVIDKLYYDLPRR